MGSATTTAQLFTARNPTTLTPPNRRPRPRSAPKLTLRSRIFAVVNGRKTPVTYTFEISPNEINLQRIGLVYGELERPGRKPLLQARNAQLKQLSATVLIVAHGERRFFVSAQDQIDGLMALSEIDADVIIVYPGVPEKMTWRITDLSIRTVRRDTRNRVTIAEAEITFTESIRWDPVVPGMALLKDVPSARTNPSSPTKKKAVAATTNCQRSDGLTGRDADTQCYVDIVIQAGP